VWRNALDLDDARVSLKVRMRKWGRAEVTVDFADGDADIKDGYLQLRKNKRTLVMAGRFKRPMSLIGLRSRWKLPSIERGLLGTLEVEGQDLPFSGGRGNGLQGEIGWKVPWRPSLTLAVFQNPLGSGSSALDASEHFTQDVYFRLSTEPLKGWTLASAVATIGHLRETSQADSYGHAPIASLESYVHAGPLRMWLEGYVGESPFVRADGLARGSFLGARALVSMRTKLGGDALRWVQPYILTSFFDPSSAQEGDRNSEVSGGAALALYSLARLQFEITHRFAHGANASAVAGTTAILQLGMRFAE
jgi:hypothetical protein